MSRQRLTVSGVRTLDGQAWILLSFCLMRTFLWTSSARELFKMFKQETTSWVAVVVVKGTKITLRDSR